MSIRLYVWMSVCLSVWMSIRLYVWMVSVKRKPYPYEANFRQGKNSLAYNRQGVLVYSHQIVLEV